MKNRRSRGLGLSTSLAPAAGAAACALLAAALAACGGGGDGSANSNGQAVSSAAPTPGQIADGRNTWLTATFGGEKFFSLILPGPPFNLPLGFNQVLLTPRAVRFDTWGVINDPDCTDG